MWTAVGDGLVDPHGIYQDNWNKIVFSGMVDARCPPCLPSVFVLLVGVRSTRGAY